MFVLLWVFVFTLVLLVIFYFGNFLLRRKDFYRNKVTSFESGFLSVGKIQNSFRVHFFIMMLMFVIFDLEIVIFLGVLISGIEILVSFLFLIVFIIGGFYME